MENKYKKKVFYMDSSILNILRNSAVKKQAIGVGFDKALKSYIDMPIIIFKAYCEAYNKVYYGLAGKYDFFCKDYYKLVRGSSPFSKEVSLILNVWGI